MEFPHGGRCLAEIRPHLHHWSSRLPRRRKRQPEGKEGSQSNAAAIGDENGSDWNDAVRWMRADSSE